MNEQELCKNVCWIFPDRLTERNRFYSAFVNLNELNIYHQCESEFATKTEKFGGVFYAERQIIAFILMFYYEWNMPDCGIKGGTRLSEVCRKIRSP